MVEGAAQRGDERKDTLHGATKGTSAQQGGTDGMMDEGEFRQASE